VQDNVVIKMYPGYQVAFAETVRKRLKQPVMAVGMLESPELAEEKLANGQADLIALGRELLRNPYWPLHAAEILEEEIGWPEPYKRAKV
jgi:NADPH2 dehydrogenase